MITFIFIFILCNHVCRKLTYHFKLYSLWTIIPCLHYHISTTFYQKLTHHFRHIIFNFIPCKLLFPAFIITYFHSLQPRFTRNWHIIFNFIPCELLFPACIITYQPHFTRNWHIILDISFLTLFLVNDYFLPSWSHINHILPETDTSF